MYSEILFHQVQLKLQFIQIYACFNWGRMDSKRETSVLKETVRIPLFSE